MWYSVTDFLRNFFMLWSRQVLSKRNVDGVLAWQVRGQLQGLQKRARKKPTLRIYGEETMRLLRRARELMDTGMSVSDALGKARDEFELEERGHDRLSIPQRCGLIRLGRGKILSRVLLNAPLALLLHGLEIRKFQVYSKDPKTVARSCVRFRGFGRST